ncbi:translational regulator [Vibrio phage 1.081.O._10N.286.52.C2]|nr:translational regulator [Vibrio phage 1.081.O._10N.286.52.C2]
MDIINKLKVQLVDDESFLKIRETLTRIGIANNKTSTLYQSCHILQKRGVYYLVHFKELLALDGRCVEITSEDIERRNNIAKLLEDWGLCVIAHPESHDFSGDNKFRIISFRESKDWTLRYKYKIGG